VLLLRRLFAIKGFVALWDNIYVGVFIITVGVRVTPGEQFTSKVVIQVLGYITACCLANLFLRT
jgi:hypothetical protein